MFASETLIIQLIFGALCAIIYTIGEEFSGHYSQVLKIAGLGGCGLLIFVWLTTSCPAVLAPRAFILLLAAIFAKAGIWIYKHLAHDAAATGTVDPPADRDA